MKTYFMADPTRYPRMTTQELRETFLVSSLAAPGEIRLAYIDLDRAVVGMASPLAAPLALPADPLLRASHFLERREIGVLNIGGRGIIHAAGRAYDLENLDCLYLGRGTQDVTLSSTDRQQPAIYYPLSYSAHRDVSAQLVHRHEAMSMPLGSEAGANRRTVTRYVHQQGAQSCQLVMGVTHLESGSIWNTMPPHTHLRRSEIYMYFNLPPAERVFHFMGPPEETRHLVLANHDIVVSPGWSIHAGAGTRAYSFCWGMGGENQDYADMDAVPVGQLL